MKGAESATTVPPLEIASRRIPELDGLRGIAVALVLAWHLLPVAVEGASPFLIRIVSSANRFTWTGVDLFFVLSGFLLGGILLDQRESPRYFTTFYARRFYRIVPLYAAMVALFLLLRPLHVPPQLVHLFGPALPLWSYLTFTQNFAMARAGGLGAEWLGPTWSLAIEEQFYLVLPPIIRFISRRTLWFVIVLFVVSAPIVRLVLWATDPAGAMSTYVLMPARADALMLGVCAALALRSSGVRAAIKKRRHVLYFALLGLSSIVCLMAFMHEGMGTRGMVLYGYSVFALLYTVILVLAATAGEADIVGKVLRWPALRRTGRIGYAVYLIHIPVVGITCWLIDSRALATLTALAVTFLIARLSWTYFEGPLVQRGRASLYDDGSGRAPYGRSRLFNGQAA